MLTSAPICSNQTSMVWSTRTFFVGALPRRRVRVKAAAYLSREYLFPKRACMKEWWKRFSKKVVQTSTHHSVA